jgi:hypothetical protein
MESEGRRQSWLAREIGKDQSEVSRIVNRGLVPDLGTQEAIALALKRSVDEFWPDVVEADDAKAAAA